MTYKKDDSKIFKGVGLAFLGLGISFLSTIGNGLGISFITLGIAFIAIGKSKEKLNKDQNEDGKN